MHGNAYLEHGRAEGPARLRRLVVSDWNGIGQVPGCTNWHCPQAINAGIDLVMVPDDWKKFIPATIEDVRPAAFRWPDRRCGGARSSGSSCAAGCSTLRPRLARIPMLR